MRGSSALILSSLLVLVASACGRSETEPTPTSEPAFEIFLTHRFVAWGYSMAYPAGWIPGLGQRTTFISETFEDHEITETLGVVKGSTIRSRHIGKDITAWLRNIVGGEITEYTKMMGESREQAVDRMIAEAESQGADGIVCMRFTTSTVMQASAELLAYGTAVRLKQKEESSDT